VTLGSADPNRARVPAAPEPEVQSRVRAQSPVLRLTLKVRRMGACSLIREKVRREVNWIVEKLGDDPWSMPQIKAVLAHS